MRSPTAFNLLCWPQVLEGYMVFESNPKPITPNSIVKNKGVNDNLKQNKTSNDNNKALAWRKGINSKTENNL